MDEKKKKLDDSPTSSISSLSSSPLTGNTPKGRNRSLSSFMGPPIPPLGSSPTPLTPITSPKVMSGRLGTRTLVKPFAGRGESIHLTIPRHPRKSDSIYMLPSPSSSATPRNLSFSSLLASSSSSLFSGLSPKVHFDKRSDSGFVRHTTENNITECTNSQKKVLPLYLSDFNPLNTSVHPTTLGKIHNRSLNTLGFAPHYQLEPFNAVNGICTLSAWGRSLPTENTTFAYVIIPGWFRVTLFEGNHIVAANITHNIDNTVTRKDGYIDFTHSKNEHLIPQVHMAGNVVLKPIMPLESLSRTMKTNINGKNKTHKILSAKYEILGFDDCTGAYCKQIQHDSKTYKPVKEEELRIIQMLLTLRKAGFPEHINPSPLTAKTLLETKENGLQDRIPIDISEILPKLHAYAVEEPTYLFDGHPFATDIIPKNDALVIQPGTPNLSTPINGSPASRSRSHSSPLQNKLTMFSVNTEKKSVDNNDNEDSNASQLWMSYYTSRNK